MSLLALPDEILLYILRTIFNNAIMGIVRPRRGAASQLPIYRSNVLRITAANKRLRALAIGLLRDKESTVEYRFNALDTGYCEVPEFWTKSPFFANTIGLPLFPSQFARSTRECLLLPPSAPASTGASDHRKMVMEWKWHDHNGNFLKDPMRHLDFVWGMGKATRESSHENLVHFMQRVRRGKINGRVEVEIKWMDQVECRARVTNKRLDVLEINSKDEATWAGDKERWACYVVYNCGLLPMHYAQTGRPFGEEELAEYYPGWE